MIKFILIYRSQSAIFSDNRIRKIKDNYMRNPIEILSKEQFQNHKLDEYKKTEIKSKRVKNIFSSQQIKNTVTLNNNLKDPILPQPKITNNNFLVLKDAGKSAYNPPGKKFKHVVENGRVFYY